MNLQTTLVQINAHQTINVKVTDSALSSIFVTDNQIVLKDNECFNPLILHLKPLPPKATYEALGFASFLALFLRLVIIGFIFYLKNNQSE